MIDEFDADNFDADSFDANGETANGERDPLETPEPLQDVDERNSVPNGWKAECGAKTKSGTPCRRPPLAGRTRCRLHGGASLAGASHPGFRHGKRSRYLKHLPATLKDGYKSILEDPELESMREEVGLLTVRITELVSKLGKIQAPAWSEALASLEVVIGEEDGDVREQALEALGSVLENGRDAATVYQQTWAELRGLIQERTRTATAEWKRLNDMNAVVTAEQALTFATALLNAAREVVTDRETLRRLQERMLVLLPPSNN